MKSFIHILTNQSKDNNCRNYIDNLKSVWCLNISTISHTDSNHICYLKLIISISIIIIKIIIIAVIWRRQQSCGVPEAVREEIVMTMLSPCKHKNWIKQQDQTAELHRCYVKAFEQITWTTAAVWLLNLDLPW